ncbi:MAG: MBOAT family O-acyltransferase [Oscillospiraceae bacterium]
MLFNSVSFLIFFPIVVLVYFILPKMVKNIWLLVASYYFYMCWRPEYALLILFSTVTTYLASIAIDKVQGKGQKKLMLLLSLLLNLSVLFLFKYYNFFTANISALLMNFGMTVSPPSFDLLLPVGISFYTFQALGYSIDVYRGDVKREKNFITYALFVSFFPQLVAGPIERSKNLLPQFYDHKSFEYTRVKNGLVQMGWGFFKKMVIADGVSQIVNIVYNSPQRFSGVQLVIATVFFAFQIYCDFSGYSDIAIGAANVLGFDLMRNFAHPYFAKNPTEFWRRWHISLSSWFMDYLYIPLGGSKKGYARTLLNLFITFLVSGLWHGAQWTFVIWGALNGIYVIFTRVLTPLIKAFQTKAHIKSDGILANIFGVVTTFLLVDFSWIFFRANTVADAQYVITNLFKGLLTTLQNPVFLNTQLIQIGFFSKNGDAMILCIIFMLLCELYERNSQLVDKVQHLHPIFRWIFYYGIILLILFYGNFGKSPFVYFDF